MYTTYVKPIQNLNTKHIKAYSPEGRQQGQGPEGRQPGHSRPSVREIAGGSGFFITKHSKRQVH